MTLRFREGWNKMTAVIAIINYQDKILIGKKKHNPNKLKLLSGKWHIPGKLWKQKKPTKKD